MTAERFLQIRNDAKAKIAAMEKQIAKEEYQPAYDEFLKANSPVERLKVYELVENGVQRRGFSRFIVYEVEPEFSRYGGVFIRAGGWWLDKNNTPKKGDWMIVWGVGNPAILKLSDNQEALPHPDAEEEIEVENANP